MAKPRGALGAKGKPEVGRNGEKAVGKRKYTNELFKDSNPADPVCWVDSLPLRYFLPGTYFIAFKEHLPNKTDTVSRLRSGTQSICFLSSAFKIHRFKHFLISKTAAKSCGGFVYYLLCC